MKKNILLLIVLIGSSFSVLHSYTHTSHEEKYTKDMLKRVIRLLHHRKIKYEAQYAQTRTVVQAVYDYLTHQSNALSLPALQAYVVTVDTNLEDKQLERRLKDIKEYIADL